MTTLLATPIADALGALDVFFTNPQYMGIFGFIIAFFVFAFQAGWFVRKGGDKI